MLRQLNARSHDLSKLAVWRALADEAEQIRLSSANDPDKVQQLDQSDSYIELPTMVLDYTRNLLSSRGRDLLLELAERRDLQAWRAALFDGEPINSTEDRAVMHVALRAGKGKEYRVGGEDIMPLVVGERQRVFELANDIRQGQFRGHSGAEITDVVNIGIGGSDLGLVMASEALRPQLSRGIRLHFVSNVDGLDLADTLSRIDAESTLFIVCSKSFSTLETRLNAAAARAWFLKRMPEKALARHFVAVSVNAEAMDEFGINPDLRFPLWDWVGGRFSIWSSIGLSLAIGIGPGAFSEFLAGGEFMDEHFLTAPMRENMPVMLALIAVWNRNMMEMDSHAVLPYSSRLSRLPAYLQQLEMESNGKCVTRDGRPVDWATAPVIWGEPGSNAQHSFFQLLHQGTANVSLDLIVPESNGRSREERIQNLANALAQAEAFARGYTVAEALAELRRRGCDAQQSEHLAVHKRHPGRRPCNVLLLRDLTPYTLGALIALYEHKVFVQGVIWGINSFDQWGVELGKQMATGFADKLRQNEGSGLPGVASYLSNWSDAD